MIDFSKINNGIDKISMPAHKEMYIESDENTSDISQHELMNAIHQEFKRSFILKLYPHLEWTDRIFWNVAGTLQQKYYEDLSLDEIITAIKRYLTDHKMIVPRS